MNPHQAMREGNLQRIMELCQNKDRIDYIEYACRYSTPEILKYLLDNTSFREKYDKFLKEDKSRFTTKVNKNYETLKINRDAKLEDLEYLEDDPTIRQIVRPEWLYHSSSNLENFKIIYPLIQNFLMIYGESVYEGDIHSIVNDHIHNEELIEYIFENSIMYSICDMILLKVVIDGNFTLYNRFMLNSRYDEVKSDDKFFRRLCDEACINGHLDILQDLYLNDVKATTRGYGGAYVFKRKDILEYLGDGYLSDPDYDYDDNEFNF